MSNLAELRGKIAVVTGGASGIGKGIAGALLAEGMSSRNRPAGLGPGAFRDFDLEQDPTRKNDRWLEPAEVGAIVVDAVRRGELYAITHPEF